MKKIIEVSGMHCEHCERACKEEIEKINGVSKAKPDAKKGLVTVTIKGEVKDEELLKAIQEAGFTPGTITVKEGLF